MYKIARIALVLVFLTFAFSCKKSKDEPKQEESHVVRGKVYGKSYTTASGRAKTDISIAYNTERVEVNLSADSKFSCSSPETRSYSVYFRVPKKVGIYTAASNDIWLGFDDSASDNSIGFVGADAVVEIKSIANGRVTGKISFADQTTDSSVDGTFDVPLCQ